MNIFSGNSLWHLVSQADAVSKLVLFSLFAMSVLCWTVFIGKLMVFRLKNKQLTDSIKLLKNIKNITQLREYAASHQKTITGYFLSYNLHFLSELTHNTDKQLNSFEWELFENNTENSLETLILHNESYLSLLSSCAAVGPLLGLFGTVWGLVHAFLRISETQVADIATVAPGIAEALITTLAGLIVAIPALIMFNYLQVKARTIQHNLYLIADKMTYIVQHMRER